MVLDNGIEQWCIFDISTLDMGLQMMDVNHIYLPSLLNGLVLLGAVYLDQIQGRRQVVLEQGGLGSSAQRT